MSSALLELLKSGEAQDLEYLTARADLDRISAAVCAFLNTNTGTIVLGVDERGKIQPVQDVGGKVKSISAYLQSHISPQSLWSVNADATLEGDVVTIVVPRGKDGPYVCDGAIYVRVGAQTRRADADAVRKMVQERYVEPVRWERQPASGLELTQLDEDEILRTAEEAQRARNYTFRTADDPTEVLADLSLMQGGQLTNAADVLFATNPSHRIPQTRIRATAFETDKGGDFVDDRVFEGGAFALLDQTVRFVQQHVRVAATFKPGKVEREDQPQYPFDALREGLINAIIHRDYSVVSGGMSVGIYPDRIEVWNTGSLPDELSVNDLKRKHPSLPANPDMAHVFHLRGIIERLGRGTVKIVEQFKAAGLPAPKWEVAPSGITLVFRGGKQQVRLNPRQKTLLEMLTPGDTIKPADYYAEMKSSVSQRQAQRDLSGLLAGGWLRQEGEGPSTEYVRTDKEQS